jgi:hypothetical protein
VAFLSQDSRKGIRILRSILRVGLGRVAGVLLLADGTASKAQDTASGLEPDVVESVQISEADELADRSESITETVTESVVEDGTSPEDPSGSTAEAAAAPSATEAASKADASGWARESFEFYPYDEGLSRGSGDVLGVPRDRLLSRTQLLVRASYRRGKWFEASISGALGVAVHIESSGEGSGLRGWSSQGTVELLDGILRDIYLGFFGRHFDLRIGQQRVAWGVADILSPNDVVNARDTRDPLLAEPEMLRLPTPLLRGTGYWGPATIELLFSPVFVPDRFSLYGGNWAAIQPDAPAVYRGLFALTTRAVDPSIQENVNEALYQTRLPNRNGQGWSAGAKLGLQAAAVDFNFYYHYGYDGTPYFWLNPELGAVLLNTDFSSAGFQDLAPVLRAIDQGVIPLFAEYVRRHHAGFDAWTPRTSRNACFIDMTLQAWRARRSSLSCRSTIRQAV